MKKLTRPAELVELSNARRNYAHIPSQDEAWKKFGDNGDRTKVREQLENIQNHLCAYCENSLYDNGHIDHFKPKSLDRDVTFEWNNLIVSCSHSDSCGDKKGNNFQNYWITPYATDTTGMFKFYINGQIEGQTDDAQKIIRDFGLDCPRLEKKRQGVLSLLEKNILALIDFPDALECFLQDNVTIFPTAYTQLVKKLTGDQ